MIRCLLRVLRLGRLLYPNQAREWLFPADSESGHLAEHKEKRDELSKWGNELRQQARTPLQQAAGVPELDVHLLVKNHSIPGVNAGYITRNKLLRDHLRIYSKRRFRRKNRSTTTRAADRAGAPSPPGLGPCCRAGGPWPNRVSLGAG